MEYLDHPFNVSTGSSRRPTPLTYEHLRKWTEPISHSLPITSVEQLQNVNQFLEQQATLYISNIIQHVIAQIIGQYGDGFKTIKATEDGALHVHLPEAITIGEVDANLLAGSNLIGKIQIEGISQPKQTAVINIPSADTYDITATASTGNYHICSIMFTVSAEVTVTLRDEIALLSGAMNFGGTGQPMGMTHNFGFVPLKCAATKKFQITTVGASQVSGVITYYDS